MSYNPNSPKSPDNHPGHRHTDRNPDQTADQISETDVTNVIIKALQTGQRIDQVINREQGTAAYKLIRACNLQLREIKGIFTFPGEENEKDDSSTTKSKLSQTQPIPKQDTSPQQDTPPSNVKTPTVNFKPKTPTNGIQPEIENPNELAIYRILEPFITNRHIPNNETYFLSGEAKRQLIDLNPTIIPVSYTHVIPENCTEKNELTFRLVGSKRAICCYVYRDEVSRAPKHCALRYDDSSIDVYDNITQKYDVYAMPLQRLIELEEKGII